MPGGGNTSSGHLQKRVGKYLLGRTIGEASRSGGGPKNEAGAGEPLPLPPPAAPAACWHALREHIPHPLSAPSCQDTSILSFISRMSTTCRARTLKSSTGSMQRPARRWPSRYCCAQFAVARHARWPCVPLSVCTPTSADHCRHTSLQPTASNSVSLLSSLLWLPGARQGGAGAQRHGGADQAGNHNPQAGGCCLCVAAGKSRSSSRWGSVFWCLLTRRVMGGGSAWWVPEGAAAWWSSKQEVTVLELTRGTAHAAASPCVSSTTTPAAAPAVLRCALQIRHPHIVNLLEVMSSRDKIFMVLELVTGGELFDKIVAEGPMKVGQQHSAAAGSCDAAAAAAQRSSRQL